MDDAHDANEPTAKAAIENEDKDAEPEDEAAKVALAAVSDLDYFKAKAGTLESDDEEEGEEEEENIEDEDEDEEKESSKASEGEEGEEKEEGSEGEEGEGKDMEVDDEDVKRKGGKSKDSEEEARKEVDAKKALLKVGEGGEVADEVSVSETGRLFVRNLPYTCTEDELTEIFKKYGPLAEVCVCVCAPAYLCVCLCVCACVPQAMNKWMIVLCAHMYDGRGVLCAVVTKRSCRCYTVLVMCMYCDQSCLAQLRRLDAFAEWLNI